MIDFMKSRLKAQFPLILTVILLNLIFYEVHCSTTENSISVTTCINDTGCQSISDDILTSALSTIEDINLVTEEVIKEWELNQKEMNTTKKVNISKIFPSFYPTSATNYNPVNKLSNDSITANINRQLIPVVKRNIDPCTCDFQVNIIFIF